VLWGHTRPMQPGVVPYPCIFMHAALFRVRSAGSLGDTHAPLFQLSLSGIGGTHTPHSATTLCAYTCTIRRTLGTYGDTHAPSVPRFFKRSLHCVRAEGTSVFESTQGLKWRELSFRLVSYAWPVSVRFVRSSFLVLELLGCFARCKGVIHVSSLT
jgi:hypothetical protein